MTSEPLAEPYPDVDQTAYWHAEYARLRRQAQHYQDRDRNAQGVAGRLRDIAQGA
jgi:hypothetical protein